MKILVLLLALTLAISCSSPSENAGNATVIVTREHDGHKFIVCSLWTEAVSMIHHPDCPCDK
jgi:hypothetical protein